MRDEKTLDSCLAEWDGMLRHFQPVSAFAAAERLLAGCAYTDGDLAEFVKRRLPAQWRPQNPHFKRYGLFLSAAVNKLLAQDITLVIPISSIDDHLKETRGLEWFESFGSSAMLDYVGYKQKQGTVIYDGDAGYAFGYQAEGKLVLTGNVKHRAGWKQRDGEIIIFGKAGDCVNEAQEGGVMVIRLDAGERANREKKEGDTYVLGSIKRYGAEQMGGGRLFVLKNAGDYFAEGLKSTAEVHIGSRLGRYRGKGRTGGKLYLGQSLILDTPTRLIHDAVGVLEARDIYPYYHENK